MANLLKSDDLNVPSEQEVFHALMEWVQHDFPNRELHIPDLLALIRLPLLKPAVIFFLIGLITNYLLLLLYILVYCRPR